METRKLYRSSSNKVFTGVCGGLGDYFNMDPVLVRLIWVAVSFFSLGLGFWGYIIASIIIPEQLRGDMVGTEVKNRNGCLYAILIVFLALIFFTVTISIIGFLWGHSFFMTSAIRQWI